MLLNCNYFSIGIINWFPSSSIKMLKTFLNLASVFLPTVSLDLNPCNFVFFTLCLFCEIESFQSCSFYLEVKFSFCILISCNYLFNIVKTENNVFFSVSLVEIEHSELLTMREYGKMKLRFFTIGFTVATTFSVANQTSSVVTKKCWVYYINF